MSNSERLPLAASALARSVARTETEQREAASGQESVVPDASPTRVAVIGLGYVGLPLAVALSHKHPVVGFDIDKRRVSELSGGHDRTDELSADELAAAGAIQYTADPAQMLGSDVFIITAPTPVNQQKQPDLGPLLAATKTVSTVLRRGGTVIYESTVYPGATEEDCVPLLEAGSGLALNRDFFVGYSPERINPGDKDHRVTDILKVTSGSTPEAAEFVDALYATVITAGTHKAPTIKVAEAAKVIENTQRDVNIALMNELSMLFERLGIETSDVLEAAGTKWNFLKFSPGLVGGHCIGVDPYYLTYKAQSVGHHPDLILAGRRLNDGMSAHVASILVKTMAKRGIPAAGARIAVMGLAFKEDTPDLRNTKIVDVVRELEEYGASVDVFDPVADPDAAKVVYGLEMGIIPRSGEYDSVVMAVPHRQYRGLSKSQLRAPLKSSNSVLLDLKSIYPKEWSDIRL